MTEKADIRKRILQLRDALTPVQIAAGSKAIVERLTSLEAVRRAPTLMVYLNFGSEVVTDDLIRWGLGNGKRIAVSRCIPESRGLAVCLIGGLDEVKPGHYGIREPEGPLIRPVPAGEIDAVIIPAVAFDRRGQRIGYGGGYYDRFLRGAPQAARIGITFACQVLEGIPADAHDIPMDGVVTDAETIFPATGGQESLFNAYRSAAARKNPLFP